MSKFKQVGYIGRSKKNKNKLNLCIEKNGVKHYFILNEKPDEELQAKFDWAKSKAEKWPEWKVFEVLEASDEE